MKLFGDGVFPFVASRGKLRRDVGVDMAELPMGPEGREAEEGN